MERLAQRKIVLDTDTGADDTLGIILALSSHELQVEAITTVSGNVHVDLCTRNALMVVEQMGVPNPPPVCKGAAEPLSKPLLTAAEVHGYDGIGQITHILLPDGSRKYPEPKLQECPVFAPQMIVDLARKHGPELTIVTVGPLTNIALSIRQDREALAGVGEIILMGGAFRAYGNTGPAAEFNIFVDPEAAQEVLDLGVPVTIIPLDVTERTILMRSELEEVLAMHPTKALDMVRDVADFYMRYHLQTDGIDGCFMHDPLAVGAAINPDFIGTVNALVKVERFGEWTRGMTVADLRPSRKPKHPNARVAVEVDSRAFLDFYLKRLSKPY